MTCIAAVEHENQVFMAGDSAGVAGWNLTIRADEKVFTRGRFILGFTSSFRMGQLLRYKLDVPAPSVDVTDDMEWMATVFIDAVRSTLKAGGYASTSDGQEVGGCFLAGYHGKLYRVDADYQIGSAADGFAAVGCGADLALGALFATDGQPPAARLAVALAAAERFSAGVRGPFVTLSAP